MSWDARVDQVLGRYRELSARLAEGVADRESFVALSREHAALAPVVESLTAWRDARAESEELRALLADRGLEAELHALAAQEYAELQERLPLLERTAQLALLPEDEDDNRNVIVEIRAGTGGDEAGLFAADLLRMYQRHAARHGWQTEILEENPSGIGGYAQVILSVSGNSVFKSLKYESGVHRVQRVPATENSGRIHTSAATVAVLPEAGDIDVRVDPKDLRIDTYRAQGAGGQHVNKTDSAVRITHLPTGIVAQCQDDKSQHKNRARAMKVLLARLYEEAQTRQTDARTAERRSQIGSGDRSERIRTYNFPQGRVTDHRIGLTLYKLEKLLEGEALDEMIEALVLEDRMKRLSRMGEARGGS